MDAEAEKRIARAEELDRDTPRGHWRAGDGYLDTGSPSSFDHSRVIAFCAESRALLPALAADAKRLRVSCERLTERTVKAEQEYIKARDWVDKVIAERDKAIERAEKAERGLAQLQKEADDAEKYLRACEEHPDALVSVSR